MVYNIKNPGFKIIEHPADTGISLCAFSIENLFEIAAEGMFSIMCDIGGVEPKIKKSIHLRSTLKLKPDDLLILWLEKLLYISETNGMLFSRFEIKNLQQVQGMTVLNAAAYGEKVDLSKHKVYISIKAPTYHKLKVSSDYSKKHWFGSIIFDV